MSQQYIGSSDEERRALVARSRGGDMTVSNKEMLKAFAIDPNYDPYSIPLDSVDPSHPSLFLHGKSVTHTAVNAESECGVLPGIIAIDDELIGFFDDIFISVA